MKRPTNNGQSLLILNLYLVLLILSRRIILENNDFLESEISTAPVKLDAFTARAAPNIMFVLKDFNDVNKFIRKS